jgi:D-citramalate synthase
MRLSRKAAHVATGVRRVVRQVSSPDHTAERREQMRRIEVMDTTLRDGEQMRDAAFTAEEKATIARILLDEVRTDRIEIASARVSEGELETVQHVLDWAARTGHGDRVEVLGFTDHKASVDWITKAGGSVMNILAKGSPMHVTKQLRKTPEEHVADIRRTVDYAAEREVSCNIYLEVWSNGMLESPDYVYFFIDALHDSGIRRFMLPDTLGILHPDQVRRFVGDIVTRFPDLHFDFHAHNDYGVGTANTLAAVEAGAHGIHCTVNGIGERAGNVSLDEAVVALHDFLDVETGIDESRFATAAHTVEVFSGRRVAFNKPITGSNVFTQTAGIHADGDKKANLYAGRLLPERFGRKREYALGKLSGRSNLDYNLDALGIELSPEQKKLVLARIIELGDLKEAITQEDLPYIISDVLETPQSRRFELRSCVIVSSMGMKSMATVKLAYRLTESEEYQEHEESAVGDGGYDALMNAIRRITSELGVEVPVLDDYQITIPEGGKSDALVQCAITWKGKRSFVTKGVDPDQVLAAAEATEKMLNTLATDWVET